MNLLEKQLVWAPMGPPSEAASIVSSARCIGPLIFHSPGCGMLLSCLGCLAYERFLHCSLGQATLLLRRQVLNPAHFRAGTFLPRVVLP